MSEDELDLMRLDARLLNVETELVKADETSGSLGG